MKKFYILTLAALFFTSGYVYSQREAQHQKDTERAKKVDYRIDNNGYWRKMASMGLATLNPIVPVKPAVYVGSEIKAFSVITEDSPDVPTAPSSTTQSENSVCIHPADNQLILNSNNSTVNPSNGSLYGSDALKSVDGALTWGGTYQGAGGPNWGDPVALIGMDGAYYIGAITTNFGQCVAKSTNQGATYTSVTVSPGGNQSLDKNHLWIDNSPTSLYNNYLYDAWTVFESGASYEGDIFLSRSTTGGTSWSTPANVSNAAVNGDFCQGTNITTGPDGQVYVIWAVYQSPPDEFAIGMTRSFDGGATFEASNHIINNIRGIRSTGVGKSMRTNSFPSMTCDISNGEYRGNIYVIWSNVGVPGINTGSGVDVYMIRSEDQGITWSDPVRVNQDPAGTGSKHYFPWITCDPENGVLSTVFYDDRNVGGSQCEVYCANSMDGGVTWEDFKVSDVAFTPSPIPNMATDYMGDYLGISARGGWVYPAWGDNRTGAVMTYVSPYETNPMNKPGSLTAQVPFETGISELHWNFTTMEGFSYFKIYRGLDSVGFATDTVYYDQLPDYGIYSYHVTAKYNDGRESNSSTASVQWGDAQISVNPVAIEVTIQPDSTVTRIVNVSNIGQLEMNYNISMFLPSGAKDDSRSYCLATSNNCDEYISRVKLNEIDNLSNCTKYANYTFLSTTLSVGNSYQITVTNGVPTYPLDQCGLWIDWNQDEIFDSTESIPMNGSPGVGPYTATITPPLGAKPGETRLRTRIVYWQTPPPCGTTDFGETEDYTVNVISWLSADPVNGNIAAGDNMEIAVSLNSIGMTLGTYTAELNVFSNDPDDPEITVPVVLNVAEVAINVTPDQETICKGESAQLTSQVTGGSGTYTYTWTSDPAGFISSDANVTVKPDITTTYYLEVFDGSVTVHDPVTITVNPVPVIYLGADTAICDGESKVLSAGEGFTSYLWNTGETTFTIETAVEGSYWVEVTNEFGCTSLDTLFLTVYQIPAKPTISSGPATVDNFVATSSTYTCNIDPEASSYQWTVTPPGAGTTISTGNVGEFNWTAGYTGTVQVSVMGMNSCGNGVFSDAYSTVIYTSAGLNEISAGSQLIIYPNPTDGKITISLPSRMDFSGELSVTEAGGSVVYSRSALTITAGDKLTLDLGQLSKGIYSLKLSSSSAVYNGRVIIK
jgi:hypothetical protein